MTGVDIYMMGTCLPSAIVAPSIYNHGDQPKRIPSSSLKTTHLTVGWNGDQEPEEIYPLFP